MRTSNPSLSEDVFRDAESFGTTSTMTIEGTAIKTGFLTLILLGTAIYTWAQTGVAAPAVSLELATRAGHAAVPQNTWMFMGIGGIGGLVTALFTIFMPRISPYTAPLYAAFEGLVIGAISSALELRFPGIAVQAAGLTFGTLIAMLLLYATRIIRPTEQLVSAISAATGAICLVYFATFILGFFNIAIPYIHQSGPIGIAFSLLVVGVAAFNLILDFSFIEAGVAHGAPKYMEWYGGFSLLMTLVWFYIEVLRLLSKLNRRD